VTRRRGMRMMVVVPAFAERNQRHPPVVARIIAGVEPAPAPHVRRGVDQPSGMQSKYNPDAADGKRSFMVMRTIITNPVVTLNRDGTASGICYLQIVVQKKGVGPQILAQGRYEDKYKKEHGEWKIAHRDTFLDMTNMDLAKEIGVVK